MNKEKDELAERYFVVIEEMLKEKANACENGYSRRNPKKKRMRKLIWDLYSRNEISLEVAQKLLDKYYE
jgi:hypothetical protein